ncbi:MAG: hypothetical protein MK108_00260 [Mariniblastus sp.]|nr:hypothetical protein [Mariniblastus sp.]
MPSCTFQVRSFLILSAAIVLALPVSGLAQQRPTAASQEYRFASSPLPGGGKVTSQSVPGNPGQVLTTVSGLPVPQSQGAVPTIVPTSGRDENVLNRLPAVNPGPRNVNFQSPTLGMGPSRPRPVIDDCQCKATEPTAYQAVPGLLPASSTNAGVDTARYALSTNEPATSGTLFEPTRYQNLPPGTYLGKSLFGKSQAYVDGEPIRNIFRFIAF